MGIVRQSKSKPPQIESRPVFGYGMVLHMLLHLSLSIVLANRSHSIIKFVRYSESIRIGLMQINETKTLEALDGDHDLLNELAQMFCEDAPLILNEFDLAVQRGDVHAARLAVHRLKGLVSQFHADGLFSIIYFVETECSNGHLESVQNGSAMKINNMVQLLIEEIKSRGWVKGQPV